MTFPQFLKASGYKPITAAKAILGYQESNRIKTLLDTLDYTPTEEEKTSMRYLVAGNHSFEDLFPTKVDEAAV